MIETRLSNDQIHSYRSNPKIAVAHYEDCEEVSGWLLSRAMVRLRS